MNEQQEKRYWGRLPEIMLFVALAILAFGIALKDRPINITTTECPMQPQSVNENIVTIEGMKCEERKGSYTDLLQPTGLWGRYVFTCWKLEMPIEELKTKECLRTGADYWCDLEI